MRAQRGRWPLRLLLDECIGSRSLVDALETAGHDVERAIDALNPGIDDGAIFRYAQQTARVIVTYNAVDFRPMTASKLHAGVLLLYQTNSPRDLNAQQIARAIDNVAATYPGGISGLVLALNDFNWKTSLDPT